MDNYLYNCNYCGVEYLPRRRNKQKYCSNSCRVNAFNMRNKLKVKSSSITETSRNENPNKIEKISLAGIGNAAIANVLIDFGKAAIFDKENKPASKKDLKEFASALTKRFFPVKNAPIKSDGTSAYYDTELMAVVYLKTVTK